MKKIIFTTFLFAGFAVLAQETDYGKMMSDASTTFQQKQEAFNNYWKGKDTKEKGKG